MKDTAASKRGRFFFAADENDVRSRGKLVVNCLLANNCATRAICSPAITGLVWHAKSQPLLTTRAFQS
jgi:hypothetical protein